MVPRCMYVNVCVYMYSRGMLYGINLMTGEHCDVGLSKCSVPIRGSLVGGASGEVVVLLLPLLELSRFAGVPEGGAYFFKIDDSLV